jgi:hypothetical protein
MAMPHTQQGRDPFDGATKVIAYVAGALVAFFGWPSLFYGSIQTVRDYAATNYPFVPSGLVAFFWGLLVLLALFGLTALVVTLTVKLLLKASGRW